MIDFETKKTLVMNVAEACLLSFSIGFICACVLLVAARP